MELVEQGDHILAVPRLRVMYLTANYCGVIPVQIPDVGFSHRGFMFRKDFSLLPKIDEAMRRSLAYIRFLNKKYESALTAVCEGVGTYQKPLGLNSLFGVVIMFLCGVACSLVYFGAEVLYCKVHQDFKDMVPLIIEHIRKSVG